MRTTPKKELDDIGKNVSLAVEKAIRELREKRGEGKVTQR